MVGWLVEHGLTSHSTQFRSFRRRMFLQVRWPNQQCQSTERGWLTHTSLETLHRKQNIIMRMVHEVGYTAGVDTNKRQYKTTPHWVLN